MFSVYCLGVHISRFPPTIYLPCSVFSLYLITFRPYSCRNNSLYNASPEYYPKSPPQVKLYSLNIKGLNVPEKRSKLLLLLQKARADIVFLQETDFKSNNMLNLHSKLLYIPLLITLTTQNINLRGVSILIKKNCPIQVQDTLLDINGRYIFIKGVLYNKAITLANIYVPNKQQISLFRTTIPYYFSIWFACYGRRFNLALTPLIDTSSGFFHFALQCSSHC